MLEDFKYESDDVKHALRVIETSYGDRVTAFGKGKNLLKFGRNEAVANAEPGSTIMTLPSGVNNETFVSDNLIVKCSSASTNDTSQTLTVEGHTISGTDLTFATQTIALGGQTEKTLSTPLARVTRAYVSSGATDLTGPVYFYESDTVTAGVPQTAAKVHMMIRAGKNQTEKCSTSISSVDYWLINEVYADVLEKTASFADIRMEIRQIGSVFRPVCTFSASTSGRGVIEFHPLLIVPKNHDVRLVAVGSAANLDVSGGINGLLAIIDT